MPTGDKKSIEVRLDDRVWTSPQRNAGVNLPIVIDRYIDRLLAIASDAGERTSRKEVVAAVLASVPPDEEALVDLLRAYRKLRNRDIDLGDDVDDQNIVTFRANRPGPRRAGSGSA